MEEKDKNISQYTLGEKIGFILARVEGMDQKLDKSIDENCKRICDCEALLKGHDLIIANAKGRVSVISATWGTISGIGGAILVWYLTR